MIQLKAVICVFREMMQGCRVVNEEAHGQQQSIQSTTLLAWYVNWTGFVYVTVTMEIWIFMIFLRAFITMEVRATGLRSFRTQGLLFSGVTENYFVRQCQLARTGMVTDYSFRLFKECVICYLGHILTHWSELSDLCPYHNVSVTKCMKWRSVLILCWTTMN